MENLHLMTSRKTGIGQKPDLIISIEGSCLSKVCLFLSCHIVHMNIMAPHSKLCCCMNEACFANIEAVQAPTQAGPKICSNWAMKHQMTYGLAILTRTIPVHYNLLPLYVIINKESYFTSCLHMTLASKGKSELITPFQGS